MDRILIIDERSKMPWLAILAVASMGVSIPNPDTSLRALKEALKVRTQSIRSKKKNWEPRRYYEK